MHTGQRTRALTSSIFQPGEFEIQELSSSVEQWEEQFRIYENRAQKKIDDDIIPGIFHHVPR
eukprot:5876829-Pyramimonas_sp.AAC.1